MTMLDMRRSDRSNTKTRINTGVLSSSGGMLELSRVTTRLFKTQIIPTIAFEPLKTRINTGVLALETPFQHAPTNSNIPTQHRSHFMDVAERVSAGHRARMMRAIKAKVWAKTDGNCWYCGTATNPFRNFEVDHFVPVSRGGTDEMDNLVPACSRCNGRKGNRSAESIRRGNHPFYGEMHCDE